MSRALLLVSLLAAGCVGPATQLRRENRQLDAELTDARAELRKARRKNQDLETENVVLRDKLGGGARADDDVVTPHLPVTVVTPPDEPDDEQPADDEAPPPDDADVDYDASDFDLGGDDGEDLGQDYTPDDDAPKKPAPKPKSKPKQNGKAARDYQAAVDKVKAKDHDGAIDALRTFLDTYPDDELADNAQYWLGEVYYDEKDYSRAEVEFRSTVQLYPKGNKVPDAMLKLGFCLDQLGQDSKARAALQQVVDTYPGTQPAKLAEARLEELQ